MCETCLYNKNCQFLAKHRNAIVEGCTAYKDARNTVDVIRCKDCKHATFYACKNDAGYRGIICKYRIGTDDENFFCSYGERREI